MEAYKSHTYDDPYRIHCCCDETSLTGIQANNESDSNIVCVYVGGGGGTTEPNLKKKKHKIHYHENLLQ